MCSQWTRSPDIGGIRVQIKIEHSLILPDYFSVSIFTQTQILKALCYNTILKCGEI